MSNYIRPISVNPAVICQASNGTVTNFPIGIYGQFSFLATVANGGFVTSTNGYDIWFSSDNLGLNVLPYERVAYFPTTGNCEFWVQLPHLAAGTAGGTLGCYINYGNPSITANIGTPSAWDANFAAVYHFGDGSSMSYIDSTVNENLGTSVGVAAGTGLFGSAVGGGGTSAVYHGGAANFAGSEHILVPDSPSLNISGALTVETWQNFGTSTRAPGGFAYKIGGVSLNGYALNAASDYAGGTPLPQLTMYNGGVLQEMPNSGLPLADTTYPDYVVGVWDGTSTALINESNSFDSLYNPPLFTGTLTTSTPIGASSGIPLYIGAQGTSTGAITGYMDELRISNVARSQDWLYTTYATTNLPGFIGTLTGQHWFFAFGSATYLPTPCSNNRFY